MNREKKFCKCGELMYINYYNDLKISADCYSCNKSVKFLSSGFLFPKEEEVWNEPNYLKCGKCDQEYFANKYSGTERQTLLLKCITCGEEKDLRKKYYEYVYS